MHNIPYLLVCVVSLTALFKHIGSVDEPSTDEFIREKVLTFIREKVKPLCVMPNAVIIMTLFIITGVQMIAVVGVSN